MLANRLMFTSVGFITPCCILPCNKVPVYLKFMLLLTSVISILFWGNPVQHSTIHIVDGILARTTLFTFMVYNILKNRNTFVLFCLSMALVLFSLYLSNHFSIRLKRWGSTEHVISHGFAHIFGIIGIYATFLS